MNSGEILSMRDQIVSAINTAEEERRRAAAGNADFAHCKAVGKLEAYREILDLVGATPHADEPGLRA